MDKLKPLLFIVAIGASEMMIVKHIQAVEDKTRNDIKECLLSNSDEEHDMKKLISRCIDESHKENSLPEFININ